MDCTQYAEDLTAFLDGELNSVESERVRSHIQSCTHCFEALRSLREAGAFVVSHSRELDPRPESWNLVRARIHESTIDASSRFWRFNRWRIAMAATAIVAALALGYAQYRQIQSQNLDRYITQYVQQRDAQISARAENNPFMEVNGIFDGNPFQSEDR